MDNDGEILRKDTMWALMWGVEKKTYRFKYVLWIESTGHIDQLQVGT